MQDPDRIRSFGCYNTRIQEQPIEECVQMPQLPEVLVPVSTLHLSARGRENANIDPDLGFIWRISVKVMGRIVSAILAGSANRYRAFVVPLRDPRGSLTRCCGSFQIGPRFGTSRSGMKLCISVLALQICLI